MSEGRIYNFAAGPSMLPLEVLKRAQSELLNYEGNGMSIMEMSHRSATFQKVFDEAKAKFKEIMNVPDSHEVLFLQGGASSQFSAVPLNFLGDKGKATYAITGNFSNIACKEAKKYGEIQVAYDGSDNGFRHIPAMDELDVDGNSSYFHYCDNNTIYGTEWSYVPEVNVPLICDMSSNICSKEIDVSKYACIYAGAQKNLSPAGLTVVIVDKRMLGHKRSITPLMMDYELMVKKDSMYNTPPCFNIYMLGLMMDYIKEQGGLKAMEERRKLRASILYDVLDNSKIYKGHADKDSRSCMNVTFRTLNDEMDREFIEGAKCKGLVNLKGHRLTGGIRASIYNSMPVEGVELLRDYMKEFECKAGI